MSALVRFHAGEGPDDRGRTRADILAWDDAALERVHDYIQWLFPLPERSGANPGAPILGTADITAFQAPALQESLTACLARMRHFYRPDRLEAWFTPGNHNLLRVTRIVRCLTVLGQGAVARLFLDEILALPDAERRAGPVTLRYWRAASGPAR